MSHDGPVGEKSKSSATGTIPKSISFDKTVKSSNSHSSHNNPPSPSADWHDGDHGGHQVKSFLGFCLFNRWKSFRGIFFANFQNILVTGRRERISLGLSVVYFNQRMGGLHAVGWSK